jgi:hypothetical protein
MDEMFDPSRATPDLLAMRVPDAVADTFAPWSDLPSPLAPTPTRSIPPPGARHNT